MNLFRTVAQELSNAFETATREDGSTYHKRKDDCADWIDSDLVHTIHEAVDDRMPCDWVYEQISLLANQIADYGELDDARDGIAEMADGLTEIYNAPLLQWLSNGHNAALADEAVEELEPEADTVRRAQLGQYTAIERIAAAMIDAIESEANDREDMDEGGIPDDVLYEPEEGASDD